MTEKYTIKDVTFDLGFLLSLTKIFGVDSKGFWVHPENNERFIYKFEANDEGKEIINFQDPLPKGDHYIFNPFAEGFGRKSPAVQFFYKTIRVAFNLNLRRSFLYAAGELLASKEDANVKLGHALVRVTSVPIDKKSTVFDVIDEKMIEEFNELFDRINDECVFVPYLDKQMIAKVKIDALTDPKWNDKFGKDIRKKSIQAFKSLLMGVLGIKDPSELDVFTIKYDPDLKSSARLHTTLSVYLKLYSRFNDIIADAYAVNGEPSERDEIDLGELQNVIDRFPLAYAIAKHMVQPSLPKHSPTSTSAADTSKLSFAGTGGRRFQEPEVVDDYGRRTTRFGQSSFGGHKEEGRRFQPLVLDSGPTDAFAPLTRTNTIGSSGGAFNSGGASNWGVRPIGGSSGGYFGGSSGYGFGGGSGLDLNPPSNFGSPATRRSYF